MSDRLSPEREAEIADRLAEARRVAAEADWPLVEYQAIRQQQVDAGALLAELAAVRKERDKAVARTADLQADADMLAALYAAGVDNWEGYDDARSAVTS